MQPANYPGYWIQAEATGQEGTRAADQTPLLRTTRKGGSGSQLSADGISYDKATDGHETAPLRVSQRRI
jgi:hypothetical protein